jgi:hypothetical protein
MGRDGPTTKMARVAQVAAMMIQIFMDYLLPGIG